MAHDRQSAERKRVQIQLACQNSEEIKQLKAQIEAASVNKERLAQIAEH
jgi:hypothetical protein